MKDLIQDAVDRLGPDYAQLDLGTLQSEIDSLRDKQTLEEFYNDPTNYMRAALSKSIPSLPNGLHFHYIDEDGEFQPPEEHSEGKDSRVVLIGEPGVEFTLLTDTTGVPRDKCKGCELCIAIKP